MLPSHLVPQVRLSVPLEVGCQAIHERLGRGDDSQLPEFAVDHWYVRLAYCGVAECDRSGWEFDQPSGWLVLKVTTVASIRESERLGQ